METKVKLFDAVEESRKWKEAASSRLEALTKDERLTHLCKAAEEARSAMCRDLPPPARNRAGG